MDIIGGPSSKMENGSSAPADARRAAPRGPVERSSDVARPAGGPGWPRRPRVRAAPGAGGRASREEPGAEQRRARTGRLRGDPLLEILDGVILDGPHGDGSQQAQGRA